MTFILKLFVLLLLVSAPCFAQAQKGDRKIIEEFLSGVRWCEEAKFLEVKIRRENTGSSVVDTVSFTYKKIGRTSYISSLTFEQILDDSSAIVVLPRQNRIVVHNIEEANSFANHIQLFNPDFRVIRNSFVARKMIGDSYTEIILDTKESLRSTRKPQQTIRFLLNADGTRVYQTIIRSLAKLPADEYLRLQSLPGYQPSLFQIDADYFILIEKSYTYNLKPGDERKLISSFVYQSDRVRRLPSGDYAGAPGYEHYLVTTAK